MSKRNYVLVFVLLVLLMLSASAMVLDKLVVSVGKSCEKELKTYCKDVTPGRG
jgi:hypothetical protein